ncbi:MAG: hypothetical protein ABSA83_13790 [Verrucomicrobiota bacterium]|jgi:hypothetical protein
MRNLKCNNTVDNSVVPFRVFLEQVGRSATCGWRWRKNGLIATINISGRLYVSQEEINRFHERAAAGEFAKGNTRTFVYDQPFAALVKNRPSAEIPQETSKPSNGQGEKCQ